jgi:hypothetical protein
MKSVIVFYIPLPIGATMAVQKTRKDAITNSIENLKDTDLYSNFHIVVVEDPARDKVETEVFFNPE